MLLQKNVSLLRSNSFGMNVHAASMYRIYSMEDIFVALTEIDGPYKILGGGSNVLLTQDVTVPILRNEIKGIEVIEEDAQGCMVKVGGGENWHHFVMWSVYHGLGGIENLALIPGTVGAAPIQNIGAYGMEQKDCFHSATVVDMTSGVSKTLYRDDCKFGYRDSIFKSLARDQYFVVDVTYLLSKQSNPIATYPDVARRLAELGIDNPSSLDVAECVMAVRSEKLPDPKKVGNAGSFFKNPLISHSQFDELISKFPEMVNYPQVDGVKLSAAWLIDQCGFKGQRRGDIGSHPRQALVLVNYGNGKGSEIVDFAIEIQQKVLETYGVELEPEVNIW